MAYVTLYVLVNSALYWIKKSPVSATDHTQNSKYLNEFITAGFYKL